MTKKEMAVFKRRKARILALIASGMSQADIGRKLGMKRQRVHQVANGKPK